MRCPQEHWAALVSSFLSFCFLAMTWTVWSTTCCTTCCIYNVLLCRGPEATGLTDWGLEPPGLWAKVNFSSECFRYFDTVIYKADRHDLHLVNYKDNIQFVEWLELNNVCILYGVNKHSLKKVLVTNLDPHRWERRETKYVCRSLEEAKSFGFLIP